MTTKISSEPAQSESDVTEALFLNLVVRERSRGLVLVTLAHFSRDEKGRYQEIAKQENGIPLDSHVGKVLQFLYTSFISSMVDRELEKAGYRHGALVPSRLADSILWVVEHGACEKQHTLFERVRSA